MYQRVQQNNRMAIRVYTLSHLGMAQVSMKYTQDSSGVVLSSTKNPQGGELATLAGALLSLRLGVRCGNSFVIDMKLSPQHMSVGAVLVALLTIAGIILGVYFAGIWNCC
jgi:hypothetical protein